MDLPRDGRTHTARLQRTGRVSNSTVSATSVVTGDVSGDARGGVRMGLAISSQVSARPLGGTICALSYTLDSAVVAASADSGTEYVVPPGRSLTRLVPPGGYAVGTRVTAQVAVPATSGTPAPVAASASVSGTLELVPIGTLRRQSGAARAFLRAGHRDCAARRVTMTLSPRARTKARRITLAVAGRRAEVLTGKALRRGTVTRGRIPARSDGAIRATVVTRAGAVRRLSATSWPCA
ncbi:hypothetical protein [Pimelobacter sp. 30-1]|uniref:hypothetical protein n=1 Tax=Pimelobacter sp. 30-1 TaxID=2004991 RepID=UPI001C05BD20|nr:hypothetical protein [Pimelobacter sp. 30-1]MBU2696871.1 hypothetical protein [Pimelobacter sp. 30-1]